MWLGLCRKGPDLKKSCIDFLFANPALCQRRLGRKGHSIGNVLSALERTRSKERFCRFSFAKLLSSSRKRPVRKGSYRRFLFTTLLLEDRVWKNFLHKFFVLPRWCRVEQD